MRVSPIAVVFAAVLILGVPGEASAQAGRRDGYNPQRQQQLQRQFDWQRRENWQRDQERMREDGWRSQQEWQHRRDLQRQDQQQRQQQWKPR